MLFYGSAVSWQLLSTSFLDEDNRSTMNSTFTVSTDKKEKIKLESGIIEASWVSPVAYGGFEAKFTVKTVFVAEGSTIEVKGKSSNGKAPDTVKGKVFNNSFKGSLLIPEKVAPGADIWFEAKLPKHGLKMESNVIPARPSIGVKKLCWDRKEVARHDIVTLTCQFEYGVLDGEESLFIIYEHNPDSCDSKLITIPAVVKGNKAEISWEFDYTGDTANIPTDAEKRAVGKKYFNPAYYFVVAVNGVRAGEARESGLLTFLDTSDITVKHGNTKPDKDSQYTITTADGKTTDRKLDDKSQIHLKDIPPGPFTIAPKIKTGPEEYVVTGKTGTPLLAVFPDKYLLVDAHMHIQSNNCCPLPLQWAIVAESLAGGILGRNSKNDRKIVNDTAASFLSEWFTGRFGKVGRLSTDLISRLYNLDLKNDDLKQQLYWTFLDNDDIQNYKNKGQHAKMHRVAGKKAQLSTLTASSSSEIKERFDKETAYYFAGLSPERMGIALLMDLSFGSYWGKLGLPLYLSSGNALYYINDFASCTFRQSQEWHNRTVDYSESVITPECSEYQEGENIEVQTHLFPSFKNSEEHLGGRDDYYLHQYELSKLRPDERIPAREKPLLTFTQSEQVRDALTNKMVHFLNLAPGEDPSRFEDYQTQMGYSIAASIRYPLSLFAFYHFDPRRHLLSVENATETMATNILSEHSFFTIKADNNKYRGQFADGYHLRGAVQAQLHPELNNPTILASKLKSILRSYKDALNELHLYHTSGPGMFWGVKMYPRLGYSPADFTSYPTLLDFYKECSAKKIPLTAHCAPGGMAIADYFLYERYDEQRFLDASRNNTGYTLKDAAKRFDGVVKGTTGRDSPSEWAKVLKEVPDLKLNLAHFGGSDTWKEIGGFEKAGKELEKRGGANPKKYDDYDKYGDWIRKIAELVQDHTNVYTDISYFVNNDPSWFFKVGYDREEVAEDLSYLINKYSGLKDRIMMGTDWYMIEIDKQKGPGDYFRKMFVMLRDVSKKVGFDAWHQFSVVNPLRFMGLIEGTKGSAGPFSVDVKNLEGLRGKMEGKLKNSKWAQKYNIGKSKNTVIESFNNQIEMFTNLIINNGDKIKDGDDLLIAQGE